MGRIEKTVFISYRRANAPWALAIFQNLSQHDYDVFLDYKGIDSGDFERVILENIRARAHFLVLLTPSALERCGDPTDWLRREIEAALDSKRNIVPLTLEGFEFGTPAIARRLTGRLAVLKQYSALSVPPEYFDAAMEKLRDRFLNVPLDAVLHPASLPAQQAAKEQKDAATTAQAVTEEELTAQQWFELGVSAADPDDQLRFFSEAIRLKPDLAEAFNNRGNVLRDKGYVMGAIEDYTQALRLKPALADTFFNRGGARFEIDDVEGALQDFNEAIRLKPDFADALNKRGIVRTLRGDLVGALEDLDAAVRLKPYDSGIVNNRGVARRQKGDLKGALEDFDEAIRLNPNDADILSSRDGVRKALSDGSRT